jgi:serine/arginine repetitive matrix protein 2
MVPQAQLLMIDQTVRDASEKPVRKQKHDGSRTGTHLSKGTVGRLKGTAVEPASPPPKAVASPRSPSDTYVATTQQPEHLKQASRPEADPESELESDLESEPETKREAKPDTSSNLLTGQTLIQQEQEPDVETPRHPNQTTVSPPGVTKPEASVRKRPSVVHEDPELEEEEQREAAQPPSTHEHPMDGVDAIPVKSTSPPQQAQEATPISGPSETVRRNRVHSESPARSPARTTHFAPKTDQLLVRHEPPPRSLSPRKSALKYSSPRDASPSEDGSDASAAWSGMAGREEVELSRKKSVRVSFDDGNTAVIGESVPSSDTDSPQIASPQSRKSWHSIIGRNKRDSVTLDEDETMTPRPALPSFGSIREKKVREPEERPLVRPMERSASLPATDSLPSESNNKAPAQDLAQSSDLAIGSVLAQEQASRNEANTSRYREPLPPVVTSVDGQGYISNSDLSSDDESESGDVSRSQASAEPVSETQTTISNPVSPAESELAKSSPSDNIPTISIIQPSPRIPDENQAESPQDFFDVPGGFPTGPSNPSSERAISEDTKVSSSEPRPSQPPKGVDQPAPIATRRSFDSTSAVSSSSQMHDIQEESEESDGSSIYSDAYEDLSDMEGDGFLSLDAVVDSPVESAFSQKVFEKAIAKSKETNASQQSTPTKTPSQKPLQTPSDWETAKAYWRSLSPTDRRQLEKEAMEESDEEDIPAEAVQRSKPKTKTQAKQKQRLVEEPVQEPMGTSEDAPVSEKLRNPTRMYQIQPGTSWARDEVEKPRVKSPVLDKAKQSGGAKLRKSMRASEATTVSHPEPVQTGGMRKSMRSGAAPSSPQSSHDGHLRKSLREEPETTTTGVAMRKSLRTNGSAANGHNTAPTQRNGGRPTSYQPATTSESVKSQRRAHSEDRGPTMRSTVKPTLTRRGSDSSESSFRRAKVGSGEGFGFRKTMRGSTQEPAASAPPPESARGSSRFSLRSLSPTGSAFRRNSNTSSPPPVMMGGRMRQSLRTESSDAGSSRMRVSGFGRSSKGKKSKSGSRFDDSSDEDEGRPAFRSRFVDSSDEDTPSPLPKQKRVPKTMRSSASNNAAAAATGVPPARAGVQDSPDLPDSDDEEEQPRQNLASNGTANAAPRATLSRSGSGRDAIAPQANSVEITGGRLGHKRRGSFMSSILRRKKDPADKISRSTGESASRRDTHLERGPERLAFIRSNSESQAHSSRLHKRGANWPLQDHQNTHEEEDQFDDGSQNTYVVDEEKRPSTAGGVGPSPSSPTTKTGFLKRRSTSHSQIGAANHGLSASIDGSEVGTPKKKKFGTLRRMFKLDE